MKCPYCNQKHDDKMSFCPITGRKLYYITQRTCYNKACFLNRYNLPYNYKVCPICGSKIASVSFWGKTPNEDRVPDLQLNSSNSSYCDVCGQIHIHESRKCPIKEKSIEPYKVCAKCGSKIISPEHKFCSKCGNDKFKNNFRQSSASLFWDLSKRISKVVITVSLVVFGILTLPLLLIGQPYSAQCYYWVKKMWSDEN